MRKMLRGPSSRALPLIPNIQKLANQPHSCLALYIDAFHQTDNVRSQPLDVDMRIPHAQLTPQKGGRARDELRRGCKEPRGWRRAVARVWVRGDVLCSYYTASIRARWGNGKGAAYLGEEPVLVHPPAPCDGALELVRDLPFLGLHPGAAAPCALPRPRPARISVRAIGRSCERKKRVRRPRRGAQGRKEVLLVVVLGADVVDEVVPDLLRTEWALARLFWYSEMA